MLASISESTTRQYKSGILEWLNYCNSNNIDFLHTSVTHILRFLTDKFNKGASYGTLNTLRSAVSLLLCKPIRDDTRIKRFFRGIYRLRPTRPKYMETWDVSIVFKYLSSIPKDAPIQEISYKTITLLALITAQRMQTLSLIKISNVSICQGQNIRIRIPDRIKTSAPGRYQPLLDIPYFNTQESICPAKNLENYIDRTSLVRKDIDTLFITTKGPLKSASVSTLSRWIKVVMKNSGIDIKIFTAHSTRHASTSVAHKRGVDIDTIRRMAGWSKGSLTFARFYDRPIMNSSFATTVANID